MSKSVDALIDDVVNNNLMDDRREYDQEDLASAYPDLSEEEASELYSKIQNFNPEAYQLMKRLMKQNISREAAEAYVEAVDDAGDGYDQYFSMTNKELLEDFNLAKENGLSGESSNNFEEIKSSDQKLIQDFKDFDPDTASEAQLQSFLQAHPGLHYNPNPKKLPSDSKSNNSSWWSKKTDKQKADYKAKHKRTKLSSIEEPETGIGVMFRE